MDATDVAAWVGAVTGVGSLVVSGATHKRQRDEPVLAAQRALRATVLDDAQAVRALIEDAAKAARSRGPLDIGHSPARQLTDWASRFDRFTADEVPRAVRREAVTLLKWDSAAHDYTMTQRDVEAHESLAEKSASARDDQSFAKTWRTAREDLLVQAQRLATTSEDAAVAVERVVAVLHAIAKRPGT